ncbi:hypothetical protein CTEN210_04305 [Chaetoceros tenuissimus]|uniref:MYND-type domain-containing protein n=1 Tax=Chaetoceros tenuissimus TaxID=426638 RepID=A0AAD3CLD9_9STRA|nr:hypothetical protein CTEN210_04305 [Chaetoceros tenuissimus]
MGKKSKRRIGKKEGNQKKAAAEESRNVQHIDEASDSYRLDEDDQSEDLCVEEDYIDEEECNKRREAAIVRHELEESDQNSSDTEIDQDPGFKEFMLWSLTEDKADLTPKKFAKMNPLMTMKLVNGDISIQDILYERKDLLKEMEAKIQKIEFIEGIHHLTAGIKFHNRKMKKKFKQQLEDSVTQNKDKCSRSPLHAYLYDSFHEVMSKWSNSNHIRMEDSLFSGKSKAEFDKLFQYTVKDLVSSTFDSVSEQSKIAIFEKYYLHPTARAEFYEEGTLFVQDLLRSVLLLYQEMYSCWSCKRLYLEAKALICAGCKCAVYCSRECQIKHWKEGKHEECCEDIGTVWSSYEKKKKRVGRALRKERIFTEPITIDGIEKECFLRPCGLVDYVVCSNTQEKSAKAASKSMDMYYKNIARLACGGKHLLFEEEVISSVLEEQIRTGYEDIVSDFDPKSVKIGEAYDLYLLAELLQYQETKLTKGDIIKRSRDLSCDRLSIDRFMTLYICYMPFNLGTEDFGGADKFLLELCFLKKLKEAKY